jgi:hypothetical protein
LVLNIKSVLRYSIFFIDGDLIGIVSFETKKNKRKWDNEDIHFTETIADIMTLISQSRFETEKKVEYKVNYYLQ